MKQVPDEIVNYAKGLLNNELYFSSDDFESRLSDARNYAIESIRRYKDIKKKKESYEKAKAEISDWLKENNIL